MDRVHIVAPDLYETKGYTHAVKVGNVLYTSGIVARDKDGQVVGKGDFAAQARQVYRNLESILRAAGATWNDVAKYNAYLVRPEDRQEAREIHFQHLPYYQRAGATIVTPLLDPDLLIEVDLIAHIGSPKHCITNVPDTFVPVGSPYAVKVGDTIYITGQQPIAGGQPLFKSGRLGSAAAYETQVIGKGDIKAQTNAVFKNFDAILKASGASWDNVVWAHGYVTRDDVLEEMRSVRYGYMKMGQVAQTSVVCGLVGPDWLIESELIASLAPRQSFTVPGVSVSSGVAHAVKAGNTIYVQGQVGRDPQDKTVGAGDIEAQAGQVYRNLDNILKGAGSSWKDVVRIKTYLTDRSLIPAIRRVRDRYLEDGSYASTTVIAGFFKPEYMLEVEAVAVTG